MHLHQATTHTIVYLAVIQYPRDRRLPSHDITRWSIGLPPFCRRSHCRGLCNVFEDFSAQLRDRQRTGLSSRDTDMLTSPVTALHSQYRSHRIF